MFSKKHDRQNDHSDDTQDKFEGTPDIDELESNLQPIDMSVFDRVSTGSHLPGDTADAAPAGDRIDMGAVAALNTSQFLASAVNAAPAEKGVESEDDPFAPKTPQAQPEFEAEAAPVAVLGADEESADVGASTDQEASVPHAEQLVPVQDDTTDEPAAESAPDADEETPRASGVSSDAAAYSRENATYEHRRGWKAMSTGKKTAVIVTIVLALVLGIAGGALLAFWQNARDAAQIDSSIQEALEPVEESIDPYWMLILGSDSRSEKSDRARSDVIMLCRIDPETPRVTMVSIPRDTKVTIEGYGTQKINAAYALGGAKLAVKTVSAYSGVKISHYAEIYFSGLEDLVDQLGGVTVNVPEYCSYKDVTLQPGVQELNGHEALVFSRCRKTYSQGDFTRTKCQRILVKALVEKVLAQPATELPGVLTSATKCFSTDIPLEDLITLATKMQGMGKDSFYSGMCPSTTGMVDGVSYTFSYVNQWKLLMQKADAGEKPKLIKKEQEICGYTSTSNTELNMKEGLPADVQQRLDTYWEEKKAKEEAKKQEELAAQGNPASEAAENESASN